MRAGGAVLLIATFARPLAEAATVSAFVGPPSPGGAAHAAPTARLRSPSSTAAGRSSRSSSSTSRGSSNGGGDDDGGVSPINTPAIMLCGSSMLQEHGEGGGGGSSGSCGLRRRRRSLSWGGRDANAAAATAGISRPPGLLFRTAEAEDNNACFGSTHSPPPGTAFPAAAFFRGGGHASIPSSSGDDVASARGVRPADDDDAVVVDGLRGGAIQQPKKRIILDHVEDACGSMSSSLMVVLMPLFHVARLGFGLSLLFYGMAFRTFAFHVIVFRIAGFKQVQNSMGQLVNKYRTARKSIRAAAVAAETVGERVIEGSDLQAAREKMIEEKKQLLADGHLSEEDTKHFMNRYKMELLKIKEEQEQFKSARSSVFSLRTAVNPKIARSSITGMYSGLVTCFTASTIQKAGQITLGLHIGNLLKTHILDMFGPILDPIGYRLDLNTYYDKEEIPYMGKANAMDGPRNMALNVLCYSVVFLVFKMHPSIALKTSMVYYGARVVTDYVILATDPARRKLGQMTIVHTPWTAVIHAALSVLGFYYHRNVLHTAGVVGLHPLAVGPGLVGLVEPCVRFFVSISKMLGHIEFFSCRFVKDPVKLVKNVAAGRS